MGMRPGAHKYGPRGIDLPGTILAKLPQLKDFRFGMPARNGTGRASPPIDPRCVARLMLARLKPRIDVP